MMAPPPRNELEAQLRTDIDTVLSGSCSSAISESAPLFLLSKSETSHVNCQSGLPLSDGDLFKSDELGSASTYGEITLLGSYYLKIMSSFDLGHWNTSNEHATP